MTPNPRLEIEKRIVLGVIGKGTVQKQYLAYYADMHPGFRSDDVISEYNRFKDGIMSRYVAGMGSTEIVKELYKQYDIKTTAKTLIALLRSSGVTIRPPTQERERMVRSKWERRRIEEIKRLKEELARLENTYNATSDELELCKSTLRLCVGEKDRLESKLARRDEEIKELMINKQKGD